MSQITENTVVCKHTALDLIKSDLIAYGCEPKEVYSNEAMAIVIFDCNGDAVWEVQPEICKSSYEDILALETNYLDGDGMWTRYPGTPEIAPFEDMPTIAEWLKSKVSNAEYQAIKTKISYSY